MRIIAIIQARMGSKRFPGKSFYPLKDKPALAYILESIYQVFDKNDIYIATSKKAENDKIEDYAKVEKIHVHRGDEDNVASRFYEILRATQSDYFVRINGDSPLYDYRNIQNAISILEENNNRYEIISSMYKQTLPSGMNVELIQSKIFLENYSKFNQPEHFEHVTQFFYQHDNTFSIYPLTCDIPNTEKYKYSFDTEEDLVRIRQLIDKMDQPHYIYTLEEKCNLYDQLFS